MKSDVVRFDSVVKVLHHEGNADGIDEPANPEHTEGEQVEQAQSVIPQIEVMEPCKEMGTPINIDFWISLLTYVDLQIYLCSRYFISLTM